LSEIDENPVEPTGSELTRVYGAVVQRYEAGDNVGALTALGLLGAIAPPRSFQREHWYYFTVSILGFRYGDHAGVLPLCVQSTAEFPGSASLWFLEGRAAAETGAHEHAVDAFNRALALAPDHLPATYELAKTLFHSGRYGEAKEVAQRSIELGSRESLLEQIVRAEAPSPPIRPQTAMDEPWLATSASKVGSPAAPNACRGVILIVGSSYCGSTLLNVLLGAHPLIGAGGEMHWLVRSSEAERQKEGRCAFCGDACPVWTPQLRSRLAANNIYDEAAAAFGVPIICDASKMPDWSRFMAGHTAASRTRVMLVKHPLRHVASFVEKARRREGQSEHGDIDRVLNDLHHLYAAARRERVDLTLRYEDLVSDPRGAITPLLGRVDLEYDAAMDNWRAAPHHHIGGNAGPRSQIAPGNRPTGGFLLRKYNRGDIFLDDSFAAVLSEVEIEAVLANPNAKEMMAEFGYEPRIEPVTDARQMELNEAAGERSLRAGPVPLTMVFEPYGGLCYLARMELMPQHRYLASVANFEGDHRRSPVVLLEDGRPLGPAHTPGNIVRLEGGGRYTHWKDVLIFSTPDNSDPNTNGRAYTLAIPEGLA
jgi:tetratricopeptide (TPR) repeat protein